MSREQAGEGDLDILIRTGIKDPVAIGLAECLLEEAEIPFFAMDRNVAARQDSGNFLGWWNVRVPKEREAEARSILRSVEETK
jgi:Putative prokaryotic signal transducing protein